MLNTIGILPYSPSKGTQTEWAEKTIKELEQKVRDIQKQLILKRGGPEEKRAIVENEAATLTAIMEFENYLNDENKFVSEQERIAIKKRFDETILKLQIALKEEISLDELETAITKNN